MKKYKVRNIYIITFICYVLIVTSFYFMAGDRLRYTTKNEIIKMAEADAVSDEVNESTIIKQTFVCENDCLDSMQFIFTKNYKEGDGQLTIAIISGEEFLAGETYEVIEIPEQKKTYLSFKDPLTGLAGKEITIVLSSNSSEGNGVRAMMNTASDANIFVNGEKQKGTMCFSAIGSDEIMISSFYWLIVGVFGAVLGFVFYVSYIRYTRGRIDFVSSGLVAINKYKFLIGQLVSRDFKSKYKRSIFGVLWSFLNPLLSMIVQFLVFSTLFKSDTVNYPVYLISGVVCFSFFSECTSMCLNSISGNYTLITKVYIPKYIFPLAKTLSSSVNLAISLVPLLLVTIVTGTRLHLSFVLMFYFLICLIIFTFGLGMILATLMVFFRDIQFLWSVLITIWNYATPIFYPAEIIPEKFRFIIYCNPLYHFIDCARSCLIDGVSPEPIQYVYCLLFALGSLIIGSFIFKKNQDKFTLYL